jgi:hypothetical protein
MSMAPEDKVPALATAAPSPQEARDLLGNFCFYLHFAIMIYIVLGFLVPWNPALIFYLVFIAGVAAHWQINKNSCVLNNAESWLRHGTWRSQHNAEEGAWLKTLAHDALGLDLTQRQTDVFTYCVMATLWGLGLWHLLGW